MSKLKEYSTKDLVEELLSREAVESITVLPHQDYQIVTGGKRLESTGPVIVLTVSD